MEKVLILGGTNFIGRRLVERLVENPSFRITLFNRGKTNGFLFPNCRKIIGDRNNPADLEQLFEESWDCIVDLSCYYPKSLRTIASKINQDITKYIFISTCSVYDNDQYEGVLRSESAPLLEWNDQDEVDDSPNTYGKRKAACEEVLIASKLPFVILRPALVYGPYDPTDRLYFWIHATALDKTLILPENGRRLFSLTYVDDLVNSILEFLKNPTYNKVYNCISHPAISIAEIVAATEEILDKEANKVSTDADFLKKQNISEWLDIPLWLNTDKFTFSSQKLEKGIGFKSIDFKTSMQHTIDFFQKEGFPTPTYGIDEMQQTKLIHKYQTHG